MQQNWTFFWNPLGVVIYNKKGAVFICLTNMAADTDRGTVNSQGLWQNLGHEKNKTAFMFMTVQQSTKKKNV